MMTEVGIDVICRRMFE